MLLDQMTPSQLADEARRLGLNLTLMHQMLVARIARDQAYLQRRRLKGINTPTDEAMIRDLPMLGYLCMLSSGPTAIPMPPASAPVISQSPPADAPISITESEHLTDE